VQEVNNPVGKLLGYMVSAAEIPGNALTLDAWCKVLGCAQDDPRSMVNGLTMLMDLSVTARNAVETYVPGDKTLFLAPFNRIDQLLSSYLLHQQWNSSRNLLDAETMSALRFGNHALGLSYPAAQTDKSTQISDFTKKLDSLLAQCLESDLTPEIKKLFIRHLEAIRKSLLDYQVGGTAELEAVVDQAVGAMHRHLGAIETQSEEGLKIAGIVFDTIAKVNELITFSQSLLLLAPAATALLPLLK